MAKDTTKDDQLHNELLANAPPFQDAGLPFGDGDPAAMMADLEAAMAKLAEAVASMPEDFQRAAAGAKLPEGPSED